MTITLHSIITAIIGYIKSHHWSAKETADIVDAIHGFVQENNPVIRFTRMCIESGVKKTSCYDMYAARPEGGIRKKVHLALYEYLKSEEAEEAPPVVSVYCYRDNLGTHGSNYVGVTLYFIEEADQDFFEEVREHIADELETYTGLEYERSPLSTCDAEDIRVVSDVEDTDFVFEVGDLKSGKFKYWGYWHEKKWNRLRVFKDFDTITLTQILKER